MGKFEFDYILRYLYIKNSIPVFIFNEEGQLEYYVGDSHQLNESNQLTDFFDFFIKTATDKPQLKKFNGFEVFAFFKFAHDEKNYFFIAGPAFLTHPVTSEYSGHICADYIYKEEFVKNVVLYMPTTEKTEVAEFTRVLFKVVTGKECTAEEITGNIKEVPFKKLNANLSKAIFKIREEERITAYSPELEQNFLSCVRRGSVDELKKIRVFKLPAVRDGNSAQTEKQYLFEVVALITLATRAAVEGGLDVVTAYQLSDLYLKQLGEAKSSFEIADIAKKVLPHFTEKVHDSKETATSLKTYSPYINKSIKYIKTHLHYPITLEDVAKEISINPKYLSRLFITHIGEKFSSYIQKERINEAKDLLENTEYAIIDIANFLSFSSQSYFIKIFAKYVGITPQKFRDSKDNL